MVAPLALVHLIFHPARGYLGYTGICGSSLLQRILQMLNLTDLQESLGGFMCLNNIHINVITQSFQGKMSLIQHFSVYM